MFNVGDEVITKCADELLARVWQGREGKIVACLRNDCFDIRFEDPPGTLGRGFTCALYGKQLLHRDVSPLQKSIREYLSRELPR